MIWWKLKEFFLKGKVFVIGLSFVNKEGQLIENYQTYGIVLELTNEGILRIKRHDNSIFQLPYNKEAIEKAKNAEYRLKTAGELIVNPDFIMTWEIIVEKNENMGKLKEFGFMTHEI